MNNKENESERGDWLYHQRKDAEAENMHYHNAMGEDPNFCAVCGRYFTAECHYRAAAP